MMYQILAWTLSICVLIIFITVMLNGRDIINPTLATTIVVTASVIMLGTFGVVVWKDFQVTKLEDYETVVIIKPTVTTQPLYTGDEVYIYGYKEDGSLYEGSGETEYTVYDTEDNDTYVKIKCITDDAKDLMKMSRECDIEIKKVE